MTLGGSREALLAGLVARLEEATEALGAAVRALSLETAREQARTLDRLCTEYSRALAEQSEPVQVALRPQIEQLAFCARMAFVYARDLERMARRRTRTGK